MWEHNGVHHAGKYRARVRMHGQREFVAHIKYQEDVKNVGT
jgi:hypothetical protein